MANVSFIDEFEGEYADDPLRPVVQDAISSTVAIGSFDDFRLENNRVVPTGSVREYDVTELEIELTNGADTNIAFGKIVPRGENVKPSPGNPLDDTDPPEVVTIDIRNKLTEQQRASSKVSRVFTGVIANSSRLGEHRFEFTAFWPGFNAIQNEEIVIGVPPAEESGSGEADYAARRRLVSDIAEQVGERVTQDTPFQYEIELVPDGVKVGEIPGVDVTTPEVFNGFDTEIVLDSWLLPITTEQSDGLLTRISEASQSIWDVDRWGNFYFGAPNPNGHKLRYITDISAGLQSPPWRSVRVIGDGVVSEDGWSSSALINETPSEVTGNVDDNYPDEGLAKPTFTYRNMEINTNAEAQHVKDKLLDEIREQAAKGNITIVGHPEIWPGDAVELPDSPNQPFAQDRYMAKKVTHRLNNDDGFTTKIEVGGMTRAAKTTFADEIQADPQKTYEDTVSQVR